MARRIIEIDQETCNGCGACAEACHEQAIGMVDGKARLLREDYCDGLGDCLPACPTGAIRFVERETAPAAEPAACPAPARPAPDADTAGSGAPAAANWPVQLRLVPAVSPVFDGCELLIAADCAAYAAPGFCARYLPGRVVLIACPKLDEADYAEKLTEIFRLHEIRSVTVTRMAVPCCGGLTRAVTDAIGRSGKDIPLSAVTLPIG